MDLINDKKEHILKITQSILDKMGILAEASILDNKDNIFFCS